MVYKMIKELIIKGSIFRLLDFPYPEYAMIQVDNHSVNYRFAFDLNSGDCECR